MSKSIIDAESIYRDLDGDGIAIIDGLVDSESLASMQATFASRLHRLRWNNIEGYEKTEPYRHMIEDVLTIDQGFVDLAIHPIVKEVLSRYLGEEYILAEAKGWKSLATKRSFHGWHGDAWYDQDQLEEIPREIKLAFYLTDVTSGNFCYIKGSHRKQHPRDVSDATIADIDEDSIVKAVASAGTAILFDTSGIHRQATPILEPRNAVFLCYHNPHVPIQKEDLDYYRYHPLILNAAFLGDLSEEDQRILGFGNKRYYQPGHERQSRFPFLQSMVNTSQHAAVRIRSFRDAAAWRMKSAWMRLFAHEE